MRDDFDIVVVLVLAAIVLAAWVVGPTLLRILFN